MQAWVQNYTALGGELGLTALVAVLPVLYMFWALVIKRMKGHHAGLSTLLLTLLIAVLLYRMPLGMALSASLYGAFFGLWPVGWMVFMAVFLYNLTLESGQFEAIKYSISSLTEDRRLQVLLIAFCFGALLESAAGFGTPVAISGAILIGLGFNPLYAAGLCLIANTVPVAFGGVGVPIITAGQVTGINDMLLSQAVGRQLPLLALMIPLYLVVLMSGWRAAKEVWPAITVCGLTFALLQGAAANFLNVMLPGVISSVGTLLVMVVLLKVWKPRHIWRFPGEAPILRRAGSVYTTAQILKAWSPYIVLIFLISLWSVPLFKNVFYQQLQWFMAFPWPGLYDAAGQPLIYKVAPIAAQPTPYGAIFRWDFMTSGGTAIFLSTVVSAVLLRIGAGGYVRVLQKTLRQLAWPLVTIASILGMAYLANYSGLSYTLGLMLASTGAFFPLLSPSLGWLGTFLTGSNTSSNALFGKLQQVTAEQIGVNPILTVASNCSGGVVGKMISPQSIAVACAATGLVGKEAEILRFTLKHSLFFVVLLGLLTLAQAYLWPWMMPLLQ